MPVEGRGLSSRQTQDVGKDRRLGNLSTPGSVRKLQRALHAKAKAEPSFRFYALYDKLYREDILSHAYAQCRANKGAPGVDQQDFADVELYGVERWLGELALALREDRYRPEPIRRVYIPKANGKLRPLGIPTLRDRVCMTAAVLVLEPIFEADLPPEQYAYRPGRSAQQAVVEVEEVLFRSHPDVVDADLSDYFGSIPHAELLKSVARRVVDRCVLHLIKQWLECPVEETDKRGRKTRTTVAKDSRCGIPQGAPITPFTQKITSSLNGEWRAGETCRCLILDANSITFMAHGAIHAGAEGETIERGLSVTLASDESGGGGRHGVAGERDFIAPCLSLSRASGTARATAQGRRACAADHLQNPWQGDSCLTPVCRRQRPHLERGGDARHRGVRGARATRWLSSGIRARSVSNTPSIDYSPPSSSRSTRYSFPIACEARVRLRC
jgi:retron-type reverse transcriptase